MILLMGAKNDAQILSVAAQLDSLQQPYAVFDSSAFPQTDTIGFQPQTGEVVLQIAGQKLALTEVKSMYWRNYMAPVHGTDKGPAVWLRASVFTLADGETVILKESYFVARCPGGEPSRAAWEPHEVVLMDDMRWWSLAEIAAVDEMIYPERLRELLPDIAQGRLPATPLEISVAG